jgi:hypothetical protein
MRAVLALALFAACGGSKSSPSKPIETRPSVDVPVNRAPPVLLDKPVWDGPLTDPMALRALDRVRTALDDKAPTLTGADPRMWIGPVQGWIDARVKLTREVRADADALASDPDPRMKLLAAIVFGVAANDLVDDVLSLEPSPEVANFAAETKTAFREITEQQAAPLAGIARKALQLCITTAPTAPAPMRVWETYCREQDAELAELEARVAARGKPNKAAQRPALFADCDTKEPLRASPKALPPDKKVKPSVAYIYEDGEIKDTAEIARLEAAVAAKLGATSGMKLVSDRELAAARKLVGQKKLHAKAPSCGQAPPLTAVVAHKAKHLVIGEISTTCIYQDLNKQPQCGLRVRYERAGDSNHEGLPAPLWAPVASKDASVADYMAAVDKLATDAGPADLLGMLTGNGDEKIFTAFSNAADEDPWLRVPWTLREATVEHMQDCVDAGASFDATFTITREGKTKNVTLTPLAAPPDASQVAACVKKALEATPWPCTPDGKPAKVNVRMCVAPKPQ